MKPKDVSSADWRKGEVARWTLASLSNDAADATFAIAFLQAWAERTCEVGVLRSRARCAATDEGVRLLWVSRGPGYLSQAEERRLEAAFDKLSPEKREVERARSSYTYGARRAKAGVGGVDLTVGLGAEHPVLAIVVRAASIDCLLECCSRSPWGVHTLPLGDSLPGGSNLTPIRLHQEH